MQYGYYMKGLLTGDLGRTITGRPIADVLAEVVAAHDSARRCMTHAHRDRRGRRRRRLRRPASAAACSISRRWRFTLVVIGTPVFVLGTVFQTVFAVRLGWFRPSFAPELGIATYFLPAIVLGLLVAGHRACG